MSNRSVELLLFALCLFISGTLGAPHHSHDHKSHCHVESSEGVIHIDVEQSLSLPGKCIQATCKKNLTITMTPCIPIQLHPGCIESKIDYTILYPDCCTKEICNLKETEMKK